MRASTLILTLLTVTAWCQSAMGQPGACCDEATGICIDEVPDFQCLCGTCRFEEGTFCENLNPPCQQTVVLGACCHPDEPCSETEETDCLGESEYQGLGTRCDDGCPCVLACPAESSQESEACLDNTGNRGCGTFPPGTFESISCGDGVCGTSFLYQGSFDPDWYELSLAAPATLDIAVQAEFFSLSGLVNPALGCMNYNNNPNNLIPQGGVFGAPCGSQSFTTDCLPAGNYHILVEPQNAALATCAGQAGPFPEFQTEYTLSVSCSPCCPLPCFDINNDSTINLTDFTLFARCFGLSGAAIDTPECICSDFNGDGTIDLLDFTLFARAFGGSASSSLPPACES